MSKQTLEERVKNYQTARIPGQSKLTPFGVSDLIYDLWEEVQRLRREQERPGKIVKRTQYTAVDITIYEDDGSYYYYLDNLPYPPHKSDPYETLEEAEWASKDEAEDLIGVFFEEARFGY